MKKKRTLIKKRMTTSNGNTGRNTSCSRKKDTLVAMCKERKLETFGMKHELVERLALEGDEEPPCELPLNNGKGKLSKSTKDIGRLSKAT